MSERIYLSPPHMGDVERGLLLEAFDSNWIAPLGPHVDGFEREMSELLGGKTHAAALSSGTAALHLALIILGIGPGDRVLVPTLTFAATANVVRYVGATPVFVDCDEETWQVSPDLVTEAIADGARHGKPPRALITVDLYGQCADYARLSDICAAAGIKLIQDAAEALGATHRGAAAGTQAELAALSFNGNKIITTSGGGMLLSPRRDYIELARKLSTQAREPVAHYEHELIGYNYRMSNLLAAVGRGQLRHLHERVAARRANFEHYRRTLGELPGWSFMAEASYGTPSRWLTTARIDPQRFGVDRERVRLALEAENIESRALWKPMHLQPVFRDAPRVGGAVSEALFRDGLCLPSGSSLREADRERIIALVRRCGQEAQ
ncbi:MAG TPA: aminotransferase class I/II-fold pyridoxal phosphate-dependent enzyme [Polyangiaceae bacterium]|nr:aminotransferase class I/II-fold pyridoxal phosphate-dependent enzyme [Polyangiaceae bacterium]